jgi:hypothetical protein
MGADLFSQKEFMKKLLLPATLITGIAFAILLSPTDAKSWGYWAHRKINHYAVLSLPNEMRPFFEANIDSIRERSIDPDQRRFADKNEGPFHFIDADRYGKYPFSSLPRAYADAIKKFGKDTVDANGTVPWRIAEFTERLTQSMKEKNKEQILFYTANLGHYVADAHVPLHSAENYDGQMSNQKGLHSRWEAKIPELFGAKFHIGPEPVEQFSDPLERAFSVILESYSLVDSVLALDLKAKEGIPEAELFKMKKRGDRVEYEYSELYYTRYNNLLNGMVERRMRQSVSRVASYWYTAWISAGKPDLSVLHSHD